MCNCGWEESSIDPMYSSYPSTDTKSKTGCGRPNRTKGFTPLASSSFIDARRVMTYDDTDYDDRSIDSQRCSDEPSSSSVFPGSSPTCGQTIADVGTFRSLAGHLDLTNTPGVAIVQRPTAKMNGPLDYAGAVRRRPSNDNSLPRKYRAALPPRGRTPCCPEKQATSKYLP